MKQIIYILTLLFTLTSCGIFIEDKNDFCACCEKTYTSITDALKCGDNPDNYKLFLFALVDSNIEQNQKLGWNILKDEEIISVAKQRYVLIIIDSHHKDLLKEPVTSKFKKILQEHKGGPYFVVTNRAFYPFREFTLHTDKDEIIEDLGLGDGP